MTAPDLPQNTEVKLRLLDNATDLTPEETMDFRPMLNLNLTEVKSKLTQINANFTELNGRTDDLLLKDSSAVQTVNTRIVFEEHLTVSGDLKFERDINAPAPVINIAEEFVITDENLLATLPVWGESYEVAFEVYIEAYPPLSGYVDEILRFSSTGKSCCSPGDRIPAFFVLHQGLIQLSTHEDSDGDFKSRHPIKLQTWAKIVVRQVQEGNEVRLNVHSYKCIPC